MKVFYIFLDIDGVLNNHSYWEECYERHHNGGIMSMNNFPFDPKCLNNLMLLFQNLKSRNYDVKIILSSTWRLSVDDTLIVNSRLAEYGMKVFDVTPDISIGERGHEIKLFLEDNNFNDNKFLILDDDIGDIITDFKMNNIIHTDFNFGFSTEKLREALDKVKILSKDREEVR